jgi:AraC-like DNA-binding protein
MNKTKNQICLKAKKIFRNNEVFWIARYFQEAMPAHTHDFYELFYVVAGQAYHSRNKEHFPLQPGDVVVIAPGQNHAFLPASKERLQIITCGFNPVFFKGLEKASFFMALFNDPQIRPVHRFSGTSELKIRTLLYELLDEYEGRPQGFATALQVKCADLLITMQRAAARTGAPIQARKKTTPGSRAVMALLPWIQENYRNPVSLEELAKERLKMSPEYLCLLFKKVTGRNFTDYITDLRIDCARHMLRTTALSVTEICFDSGFNDLSHFTRIFHRHTGMPPGQYRKKNCGRLLAKS